MLIKFRTRVAAFAMAADKSLPPEMKKHVETDLQQIISAISSIIALEFSGMQPGVYTRFREQFAEFLLKEVNDHHSAKPTTSHVCEDWKSGMRLPNGACTNCGEKHS